MDFSWSKVSQSLQKWYRHSPIRAIDRAYEAALKIQELEKEYFGGNPIVNDGTYGSGTYTVLQTQLRNYLNIIRLRLLEYKLSSMAPGNWRSDFLTNHSQEITAKLAVIDRCLERYDEANLEENIQTQLATREVIPNQRTPLPDERSMFPFSISGMFQGLREIILPSRKPANPLLEIKRRQAFIAIRFCLTLILVAILTQWSTKNLIYSPLVDFWVNPQTLEIKFDRQFKTEALEKFRSVQETIELESLVAQFKGTPIDREAQEERLKNAAKEILIEYNYRAVEGIKNLLADVTTALTIYLIITFGREKINIVWSFFYDTLAGLNDSAKAFLIIVSTDTFVGYHSSDGWDALLKVLFAHFGLEESAILTDTFIATVPVFLDALFKYWIFQYLRRASPPTSAIYREMND